MKKSRVLEKLRKDEWVVMPQVGQLASFKLVEMLGMIGFDCAFIDMEHTDFSYETLAGLTLACRATGMDSAVRVANNGYTSITKPLEAGATGLVISHCMNAEEAAQAARWAKFAPEGLRGVDGAGVDGNYHMMDLEQYVRESNKETFLVVMIEDKEAIAGIDEIAVVSGIDILFIGPADLSQSYGVFPQFCHKLIEEAIDKVAEAAVKNNKWWGLPVASPEGNMYYPETFKPQEMIKKGARFFIHGSDVITIPNAFREIKRQFDNLRQMV